MLEFWDFAARREDATRMLNIERAAIEGLLAKPGNSVMAVMTGPRQLIRAVALWRIQSAITADVQFSVDDSVRADGVFVELLYRVADDARAQGIRELRLDAPTGSDARAVVAASGFPVTHSSRPNEGVTVDISGAR